MDVLLERESGTQVVNNAWGDGRELGIRNLWWTDAGNPFYRHVIPMRTALEGIEMAAGEGLLTQAEVIAHCARLLGSLSAR